MKSSLSLSAISLCLSYLIVLNSIKIISSRSFNSVRYDQFDHPKNDYFLRSKWKSKHKVGFSPKQDGGQVVGILTPGPDLGLVGGAVGAIGSPTGEPYLPNFNFWADFGSLIFGRSPTFSPYVRLSRDLFESQQCAEYVSCEVSKISRRYSPLQFMHNFLQDFPFQGDLAMRLKDGSSVSSRNDKCGFRCNPMDYLNKGVKTLSLLHAVMDAANPARF